jgi:hypothetical protein
MFSDLDSKPLRFPNPNESKMPEECAVGVRQFSRLGDP